MNSCICAHRVPSLSFQNPVTKPSPPISNTTSSSSSLFPPNLTISARLRSQLRRNPSTMAAQSPKQDQQSVAPFEKVIVKNNKGENLVGLLHETGSTELVILCHGFRSSKESSTIANLADAIAKEGISVFRFDFAGNGESEGSFQYGNYLREADDLRSVVQYFSGSKHTTITILGHSKGGNVVLLYASKYQDIPTVVNVSGRYNLRRGIEERLGTDFMKNIKRDGFIDVIGKRGVQYRVTEDSLMERLGTDMHAACLSIDKGCRVLTVHGTSDEIIPLEDASEFAKIIQNHKLQTIEEADHGYSKHQDELAEAVVNFIKAFLQQGRAT